MTAAEPGLPESPPQPARRWLRRLGMGLTGLLVIVVALVALLQLPPVATFAVRKLLTLAPLNPGNRLEVGRVSGNFLRGLTLENVSLHQDGRQLARLDRVELAYRLSGLLAPTLTLDELAVDGGMVAARRQGQQWDLLDVLRTSTDTTSRGGGLVMERVHVGDLAIAARFAPDSVARLQLQTLAARGLSLGDTATVALDTVQLAARPPASARWLAVSTRGDVTAQEVRLDPLRIHTEESQVTGRVVVPRGLATSRQLDRLDVQLSARPLALEDLAAWLPSVPASGRLAFDASARGRGDRVTAHVAASLDTARLTFDGDTRLRNGTPTSYRAHGVVTGLDPSRLSTAAPAGVLNGRLDADLSGPLDSADGRARLALGASRVGSVGIRRLELGALLTRGTADLTLRGALDTGRIEARGRARPFDPVPTYRVNGTATGMPGTATVARALTGAAGEPVLAVGFRLSGAGTSPDSANVTGRMELAAVRDTGARRTVARSTLRLAHGRLRLEPVIYAGGGTVTALARVSLGDTLAYELRDGRIEQVDLGALTGDTAAAPLSGTFSLVGRGTAPAVARVTTRVHFDELRAGPRRIEGVDGVARLDRGRLTLTGNGALQGGRVVLEALGRPFDSTASYVLRRAALEGVDLGTFMGRPDLAGPVTLSLRGEARLRGNTRSGHATLTLQPSRLGRIEVVDGGGAVGVAGEDVRYDVTVRTNGGVVSAAGDATPGAGAPAYRIREGRLAGIDLGTLLGRADLRTDLNATFTADLARAPADSTVRGAGGVSPDTAAGALGGTVAVALLPSTINDASLTSGSIDAHVRGSTVRAKLRAEGPDAALDASLDAAPAGERTAAGVNGTLRVEHLARWTGRRDADGRVESRFDLTVERDSSGLRTARGTLDALGGVGDVRVPAFRVALSPADGQLQVDTVLLRSNVAAVDGAGRVQLRPGPAPGTLRLAATLGDLAPVAALMGADTVGADSAHMRLAIGGPAWHWRLDAGADAYGLAFAGTLANRLKLAGRVTLDSTRIGALAGDLEVKDAAVGKLSLRELSMAGGYDSTLALDLTLNVADSVRIESRIRGTVSAARDTIRAELQRLTLDEGGRAWALARPAAITFGPAVRIDSMNLQAGQRSIAVNGVLDRRGASDMTLSVTSLDLETLRAAGLVPIGGRLDGRFHLSGPADSPRLQGGLTLAIRSKPGQEIGTLGTTLDWTGAGLQVSAAAKPLRGSDLTVEGSLPYRLTLAPHDTAAAVASVPLAVDKVSLAVRADSFDLALFQPLLPPDAATGLGGRLRTDARIGGTVKGPSASGTVNLARATLELPSIGVKYQRGELAGRLDGDALQVEKLRLLTDKHEELLASGTIGLKPLSDPTFALDGTLTDFRLVNSDQLKTSATGRVQVAGSLLKPVVTGKVRLGRTDFFVGAGAAQARVEQVDLTPAELRKLARDFGPSVLQHGEETPGLMDRAKLELAVSMPGQVWIRRTSTPKADIELMGNLRLTQEPGQEMRFFGHVEPVPDRGTLELSGKQFRLTDGDINLAGPIDSTRLDVNASYQVPTQGGGDDEGVLIDVHAQGRLDSLALSFTSDPQMSQDDILSYIVTGRPASDNPLFEGGAGGGNAGEQVALGTLTTAISNAAGQGLGFDVFQIRQEPTRGLTLTAGRYVGSRLFLDLQLPLQLGSQSQQQTPGASLGPGFELEYRLERWLRAYLRGGSLSPGFLFRARRAY